jgi:hypothetical protein
MVNRIHRSPELQQSRFHPAPLELGSGSVYAVLKKDWMIITASSVSFVCLFGILYFKWRQR